MRIKKVRLKNGYKRFRDLTIDLGDNPARVVALVGPNGCGKSSVLDGLLYHQHAYEVIGGTGPRDYRYHSMDANDSFNYQNIEINFIDGSYYQTREARVKIGKANTVFSFRSPYRYNTQVKISEIRSAHAIRMNNYGAGDASSLDSKMEDNYRRLLATINRYMQEKDTKPSEARSIIIGDLNKSIKKLPRS